MTTSQTAIPASAPPPAAAGTARRRPFSPFTRLALQAFGATLAEAAFRRRAESRPDGTPDYARSCGESGTVTRSAPKPRRNAPCGCGSGRKAKRCCSR